MKNLTYCIILALIVGCKAKDSVRIVSGKLWPIVEVSSETDDHISYVVGESDSIVGVKICFEIEYYSSNRSKEYYLLPSGTMGGRGPQDSIVNISELIDSQDISNWLYSSPSDSTFFDCDAHRPGINGENPIRSSSQSFPESFCLNYLNLEDFRTRYNSRINVHEDELGWEFLFRLNKSISKDDFKRLNLELKFSDDREVIIQGN